MIQKIGKFALVGVINTALDFALFNLVAHVLKLQFFGLSEAVFAQICSGAILVPLSYHLNKRFTFQSNKKGASTVIKYLGVSYFNAWILQTAIIFLITSILGPLGLSHFWILNDNELLLNNIAKCAGIGCGMISNFTFYHFIFKEDEPALYE
jgi:putative flippase GtrA